MFFALTIISLGIILGTVLIISQYKDRKAREEKRVDMSFMEGLNLTGFPIVSFHNNNRVFNFLLDTGSNVSLINGSVLTDMAYENDTTEIELYGLDGISRTGKSVIAFLSYKNVEYKTHFLVTDLNPTFMQIKKEHGVQLHGLLGSDFFKAYKYVLDFDELIAYSKLNNK